MATRVWVQRILWIDGLAALSAGVFVLILRSHLSTWYALPVNLLTFIGLVNIGYSAFGLTLAMQRQRHVGFIVGLAMANLLWAGVCGWMLAQVRNDASLLGLAHIAGEGVFVAALAVIEWRNRHALAMTSSWQHDVPR